MKKILTGSSNLASLDDAVDMLSKDENISSVFEDLMAQIFEYESQKIMYTLKLPEDGFSRHWFINAKTRMIESFPKRMRVEIISEYDDDNYLCFAGGCDIIVKKDLLLEKVEF